MTDPTSTEHPDVALADFWGGDLPTRTEEAPDAPYPYLQLATPDLEVGGRNLAAALAPVYRALTR
ncbi:hypothetical protein ACFYNO_29660 [Kitasatospora sp. NPDC006697]|uniref:hypothetical protein n=1 Tax=Kitasatospora sp. NPDC006697 TaxID=3364020 RepID=UPI0036BF129A